MVSFANIYDQLDLRFQKTSYLRYFTPWLRVVHPTILVTPDRNCLENHGVLQIDIIMDIVNKEVKTLKQSHD